MKQFYLNLLSLRQKKNLLFSLLFVGLSFAPRAQQYTTRLTGPNEVPVNNSPGTGIASVTITGNLMRVQVSFSGLTGNTTASHIHAATAAPEAGTAGVA